MVSQLQLVNVDNWDNYEYILFEYDFYVMNEINHFRNVILIEMIFVEKNFSNDLMIDNQMMIVILNQFVLNHLQNWVMFE
jgi:hypothetical protein